MSDLRSWLTRAHRLLTGRWVRLGFLVLVLVLVTRTVLADREEIRAALADISSRGALAALVALLAGLMLSLAVWRALAAGLGSPLPWPAAGRILFLGQLGKYVPGALWPMLAQMELGDDHGVPRRRSATVFGLLMLLNLISAFAVAGVLLPWSGWLSAPTVAWLAAVLAPLLLVAFHPRVLNPVAGRLLGLAGRAPLEQPLTGRWCATALVAILAQWVCFGLHVLALGVDLGGDPAALTATAVGGYALAWALGPLLVVAPAGLGVREFTLVAVLAPQLGSSAALVVAVASRVLMTLADLALALGFGLAGRRRPAPTP